MTTPNPYKKLVTTIARGETPPPRADELDALLHWLAGRDTEATKAISQAFKRRDIAPQGAERLTLLYLDATLFAHQADPYRLFGLTPECSPEDIRARHKRLMQVFHPDRHQDNTDWFTKRSERINHAYAFLKQHHGKQNAPGYQRETTVVAARGRKSPSRTGAPTGRRPARSFFGDPNRLRRTLKEYLGSSGTLQQRTLMVLFTAPVVLLLVLYLTNQEGVNGPGISTAAINSPARANEPELPERTPAHDPGAFIGTPFPRTEPVVATNRNDVAAGSREIEEQPDTVQAEPPRPEKESPKTEVASAGHTGEDEATTQLKANNPDRFLNERSTTTPKPDTPAKRETRLEEPEKTTTAEAVQPKQQTSPVSTEPTRRAEDPPPETDNTPPDSTARSEQTSTDSQSSSSTEPKEERKPERESAQTDDAVKTASVEPERQNSGRSDIEAISKLLDDYKSAYTGSDIKTFSALFQHNAETKYARGRAEIKEKYGEFFEKTSERTLVFTDVRISLVGNRQFKVNTHYEAVWSYPDGDTSSTSGRFELHLTPSDENLKIWRLTY